MTMVAYRVMSCVQMIGNSAPFKAQHQLTYENGNFRFLSVVLHFYGSIFIIMYSKVFKKMFSKVWKTLDPPCIYSLFLRWMQVREITSLTKMTTKIMLEHEKVHGIT